MTSYKVQVTIDLLRFKLRKWSAQIGQGEGVGVGGYTEYSSGPCGEGGGGTELSTLIYYVVLKTDRIYVKNIYDSTTQMNGNILGINYVELRLDTKSLSWRYVLSQEIMQIRLKNLHE
jgi:hypothetical protein